MPWFGTAITKSPSASSQSSVKTASECQQYHPFGSCARKASYTAISAADDVTRGRSRG